jgi:hypothetical protein
MSSCRCIDVECIFPLSFNFWSIKCMVIMNKSKKINPWYIIATMVILMLAFGYFFNIGESLGKALAN